MSEMSKMNIVIRRENANDYRTVEELTRDAFWDLYIPGCDEHYVTHILRTHPDFIPEMDFVAEHEGKITGNIMYTKSYVIDEDNNRMETVTFGPICVLPEYQRRGVGTALINHTREIALKKGISAIIILGYPHNYCKHGFVSSRDYMISDSNGRYPFGMLAYELNKGIFAGKKWKFYFSSAYDIDSKEVEKFDNTFPFRAKKTKPSQAEFSIAVRAFLD